jgi:urease accessory protein
MTHQLSHQSQTPFTAKTLWPAHLAIELAPVAGKTALVKTRHFGPLRVQRPFYPEGETCHLYLLHPPGGLASGDTLTFDLNLKNNSHALITAPGAQKFYQSSGEAASIKQTINVEVGAVCEWLPHETIYFNGAKAKNLFDIHLAKKSQFIGWEMNALARPANQERFTKGCIQSTMRVFREAELLLHETFRVESTKALDEASGLRGFTMQATFIATPFDDSQIDAVRALMEEHADTQSIWGVTAMDDLLIVRVLTQFTETARSLFELLWQWLRPRMLNKAAVAPRIWTT